LSDLITTLERARAQSATIRRRAAADVARQLKPTLGAKPRRRTSKKPAPS
jgi:hypothetical protein